MRIKLLPILLVLATLFLLPLPARAEGDIYTARDEILAWASGGDVQGWLDTTLTAGAGTTAEWYVLSLAQTGWYDFSSYDAALRQYLADNEVYSATSRLKYALLLAAVGDPSPYITEALENSTGQQGVMSWIFALHVMENGYSSPSYTADDAAAALLSLQLPDGGWAIMGTTGDVDVTAMAIQALAPRCWDPAVSEAVDRGLALLSERQLPYGGYASFGTENLESTAQVVTALACLGIDPAADARFIKDGVTLYDGMARFRLPDGTYSHIEGGGFNENATVQALYSYVAAIRCAEGRPGLYVLDHAVPIEDESDPPVEDVPLTEAPAVQTGAPSPADGSAAPVQTGAVTSASRSTTVSTSGTVSTGTLVTTTATVRTTAATVTTVVSTIETGSTTTAAIVPTETAASVLPDDAPPAPTAGHWRPIALGILWGIALVTCVLLWVLRKRSVKNFVFVIVLAVVGTGVILCLRIEAPEDYYGTVADKPDAVGTVQVTIRCDALLGKTDDPRVPADGVILAPTDFPITAGETALDLTIEAARQYSIQLDHRSNGYVAGIAYLYELEFGDLSGWMYRVNGETCSVGCGERVLEDGDVVEWLYTCDIGNDLAVYDQKGGG